MTRHCLAGYRGHVLNHILGAYGIGATTLARLEASAIGDFRDSMRNAGVSVPTTRKILSTLHGILQFAIGKGWLAINAAHGIRVIGRRDEGSKKIRPPTKESVAALLTAADEDLRVVIWFAVLFDQNRHPSVPTHHPAERRAQALSTMPRSGTGALRRRKTSWTARARCYADPSGTSIHLSPSAGYRPAKLILDHW